MKLKFLTAAALLFTAVNMSAADATAYATLCCSLKSPVAVLSPESLAKTRSLFAGAQGDSLALSPDGTRLYVTSDAAPELQVLAARTGTVIATVPIPVSSANAPFFVAASPDGARLYVWAPFAPPSSTLFAIDAKSFAIVATVSTPKQAENFDAVLVSPDSTRVYVELDGGATPGLQIIDAATLTLGAFVSTVQYSTGLAMVPNGKVLDSNADNHLLVIDPQSATIAENISLPGEGLSQPAVFAVSPDSSTAYLSFEGPSILAVTISDGATLFDVPVQSTPVAAAVSSDGTKLYLANGNATVSELNTVSQTTVATTVEPGPLRGIALGRKDAGLYVLEQGNSGVATIDVATQEVTHLSDGGTGLNTLAIQPGTGNLWISQSSFSTPVISILSPATVKFEKNIAGYAGELAFSPDGSKLYVAESQSLAILNASTFQSLGRVPFGGLQSVDQVVVSPDGSKVFVSISEISGIQGKPPGNELLEPGYIAVIDTSSNKITAEIAFPDGMGSFVLTPDGTTLVELANNGRVHLASTSTHTITATIHLTPANGFLSDVALSPDATTAYVTDGENSSIFVVDLTQMFQTVEFAVGNFPSNITVTPDGSEALIITAQGLQVVNLVSNQVIGTIALPAAASKVIIAP